MRDLSRGRSFDEAALVYDQHRPRYPRILFDDIAALGPVDANSRILEIGCGPGVATESLLARGWSVLAVEPGEQLARLARQKFDVSRFDVEVATFEEWSAEGRRFDVVLSASAFHWVAPQIRWVKAASVLNRDGVIALLGHESVAEGDFHEFVATTRELRARHGVIDDHEELAGDEVARVVASNAHDIGALWEALSPQPSATLAGDLFAAPEVRVAAWSATYSTEEALGLLGTYSRYLVVDPVRRERLFAALAHIIDHDFAGHLTRHYVSVLALARRGDAVSSPRS